jgi:hypothetical protein
MFNLTIEEWEKINSFQDGLCWLCLKKQKSGKRLATDHDHTSGLIRCLLCSQCNRLFGKIEREWQDRIVEILNRLIQLVLNPPAVRALGREVYTFAGRLGTKRHRKFLKKNRKASHTE